MRLILASASQRREQLLSVCGYDFEVVISNSSEELSCCEPDKLVCRLALKKAKEVYLRLKDNECVVIGADTIVVLDGEIIGKPKDTDDARRLLRLLSGRTHIVYTGVAVVAKGHEESCFDATYVKFAELRDDVINAYVSIGESLDKAGAYGIQGQFGMFVEHINGNYFNVMGLPLPLVYQMLCKVNIKPEGF